MITSLKRAVPVILLLAGVPAALRAGDPPPGPPWLMTWPEARAAAIETGRPIFIYFTKTY